MKKLFAIPVLFLATSVFAATEKIECQSVQTDARLQIVVDTETSAILGAEINANFKKSTAVGSVDPMAGYQVILEDNTVLDIDYAVFGKGHNGLVTVNSQDEYLCH